MKKIKLLVGLGNPGSQYATTRHNVGRIVLDRFCEQAGFTSFLYQKKFLSEVANGQVGKRQTIAIKPQTFMNKSGDALQKIVNFYNIGLDDILVIQDEIDLPSGQIKLKYNGSPAGHNGIKDIVRVLDSKEFWRLRLGVGRPVDSVQTVTDYVLGRMSQSEIEFRTQQDKQIQEKIMDYMKNTG